MPLNRQRGRVRAPRGGGRAKIENSSKPHPRKFGQKRFLAVRRSWRGNGVACFWATSLEEIIGGVTAIVSYRSGGWMQRSTVPRCAILSVGNTGVTSSEAARVHIAARGRGGGVAARGARAAASDAVGAFWRKPRPVNSRGARRGRVWRGGGRSFRCGWLMRRHSETGSYAQAQSRTLGC
jgi:hypothetical protein